MYVFCEIYPSNNLLAKCLMLLGIIGVCALLFDNEEICGPK